MSHVGRNSKVPIRIHERYLQIIMKLNSKVPIRMHERYLQIIMKGKRKMDYGLWNTSG